MLSRVAFVRTDVSEERIASIIRVTRIGEIELVLRINASFLN
jgi:outer membrane lipopolysaccharide assembly protein LptE/RlpB